MALYGSYIQINVQHDSALIEATESGSGSGLSAGSDAGAGATSSATQCSGAELS